MRPLYHSLCYNGNVSLRDDALKFRHMRQQLAKAARRRYQERAEAGICVRCGKGQAINGLRCDPCREAWSAYRNGRRKAAK